MAIERRKKPQPYREPARPPKCREKAAMSERGRALIRAGQGAALPVARFVTRNILADPRKNGQFHHASAATFAVLVLAT